MESVKCETPSCNKPAKMKCPTCLKIGIESFFCGQDCFKGYWKSHKILHVLATGEDKNSGIINLYPNYNYSGKLRPWPQTPKRSVPESIQRTDYANHPEGKSLSEEKMRGEFTCQLAVQQNCITFDSTPLCR